MNCQLYVAVYNPHRINKITLKRTVWFFRVSSRCGVARQSRSGVTVCLNMSMRIPYAHNLTEAKKHTIILCIPLDRRCDMHYRLDLDISLLSGSRSKYIAYYNGL